MNYLQQIEVARYRQELYQKIRTYFKQQGVLEVETPVLSLGTAVDAHIDVMTTRDMPNASLKYLQTSPELYMKRLLCRGFPSIFQIGKVFRKEEQGKWHRPEFSMLEWYRLDYGYRELMTEVSKIVQLAIPNISVVEKTYRETFLEYTPLDPFSVSTKDCMEYVQEQEHKKGCGSYDFPYSEEDSLDDWLVYILSMYIEPRLPKECLYFIYNYPVGQANLAQVDVQNPSLANRFEAYYQGIELCNGFQELLGGSVYQERFKLENYKRGILEKQLLTLDTSFLEEMSSTSNGLPPCSGVALGMDRLVALALGGGGLDEALLF
jgi:lysyl-tRNA synthetase class 2